jgi:multicomponent Na+:H+ antiporter subunit G
MGLLLDILTWILLLAGAFFCLVGGIGILRLPDFFTRTHASGVTDTLAAGCVLIGLMLQTNEPLVLSKLVIVIAILWFTSPTSGYALARAALSHGLTPRVDRKQFDETLREDTLVIERPPTPGGEESTPSA